MYPSPGIHDGAWHELEYVFLASHYELKMDGNSLRTINDTSLPQAPMALYAAVNVYSATRPLRLEIDQCSFSVVPPELDAEFVAQGSDAPADSEGKAYYRVCAGSTFHFWFEVRNTGVASWVDWDPSGVGPSVRLGVPSGEPDVFTHTTRVSLNENLDTDVRSAAYLGEEGAGIDCNDQPLCQRTRFAEGEGISATAPSTPGVYTSPWKLIDEARGFFGPVLWLSFNVIGCP